MLRMQAPAPEAEPQQESPGPLVGRPQLLLMPNQPSWRTGESASERALEDAIEVTNRVRLAHVAAALVYAAVVATVLVRFGKLPLDARLAMACLALAPQLAILSWSIRASLHERLSIFLAYVLVGGVLALLLAGPRRSLVLTGALIGPVVVVPLVGLCFLLARRAQPFLVMLVATLLYVAGGVIVFELIAPHAGAALPGLIRAKPWLVAAGLANVVLGVILAGALLKRRRRGRVIGSLAALAVASLAAPGVLVDDIPTVAAILSGTAGCVLQTLFVWLVFKLLLWLQGWQRSLTSEILHAHVCWGFVTLTLLGWTLAGSLFGDAARLRWGLLLAFALHLVVLHTLLIWIRSRRSKLPPRRLLLLRVFGRADESEDLLDTLGNTWRRIGAVDLLAGSDVASRTLQSSMLEAFFLRRSDDQFLKSDAAVDARLRHLPTEIDGDVRYPVNGVFCYTQVWQRAFVRLAGESAVVLMDVRGFTADNRGCAWELAYLLQHTALGRIVLLADRRTDMQALEQEARAAWTHLSPGSPNAQDSAPGIRVLRFTRRSTGNSRTLFEMLLAAASEAPAAA